MCLEKSASDTDAGSSRCRHRRGKLKRSTSNTRLKQQQRRNRSQRKSHRKCTFAVDEPDNVARSFPLHFHQLKTRMDLNGMVDTATLGSERMVVARGRNVKRLWTRMVAGGITKNDHVDNGSHDGKNVDNNGGKDKEDDDSISNVSSSSSSSKSSACSYQPTGVYSQMSYGTTSVIGMENVGVVNGADKTKKQHPLLRLMSMVHALP